MFFQAKNPKLKPRVVISRSNECTTSAHIQLEQREMLAGLNVGDIFVRDANPSDCLFVTEQVSETKFAGYFVANGVQIDVSIKCKPNGQFIVKAKNEIGKATVKAKPVAGTNPLQVTAKGFIQLTGQPKAKISGETFTLQSKGS